MVERPTQKLNNALLAQLDRAASYPLSKALIMLCRGEVSERICRARAVTEDNAYLTLSENGRKTDAKIK